MRPTLSIRKALGDPGLLGSTLRGDSWAVWRVLLIASMGEALTPDELQIFTSVTGRTVSPTSRLEELIVLAGRRGGKTRAMGALVCYIAALCDHKDKLVRGEKGLVLCIAPDTKQAHVLLEYCHGTLEGSPVLRQMIAGRTADSIELTSGISIEVRAASFRRLRGVTCVAVCADESCFWFSDDSGSQNADSAILDAVRPTLATTGGMMAIISSPYAKRGETWELFRRHHGPDGDPAILVAQGASRTFNPSLPQSVIDRAMERDAAAASSEYLGLWRDDIAQFVSLEAVESCVDLGVRERPRVAGIQYVAFCDPSGGSSDSMTLAIAHKEKDIVILDCCREVRAPFSTEAAVEEFSQTLKSYGIMRVKGDRYGGAWPAEQFAKRQITYEAADKNTSELYLNFLPLLNSRRARLLNNQRLIRQLSALERRTSRSNKDSISHPPNQHDDLANSVAGVLVQLVSGSTYDSTLGWVGGVGEDGRYNKVQQYMRSGFLRF